jgi:DNA-directed RNA polymerase specialized sigma subunit
MDRIKIKTQPHSKKTGHFIEKQFLMEKRRSLSTTERKLIFNWKEEGIEQQEMAKRLKISNYTVTYVLKNYTKENCLEIFTLGDARKYFRVLSDE